MLKVSDFQVPWMSGIFVHGHVKSLRDRGLDVHEFATEYVNRTEQLGYAPDLAMSVREFMLRQGSNV